MVKINIITPVSRPQNIYLLHNSIKQSLPSHIQIKWILVLDENILSVEVIEKYKLYFLDKQDDNLNIEVYSLYDKNSKFGNAQRNLALTKIEEGWVYFLDDDTVVHSKLFNTLFPYINENVNLILFSQKRDPSEFPFVEILIPNIEDIRKKGIGSIDTGQLLYRSSIIEGQGYYPIDLYQADGALAEKICKTVEDNKTRIVPEILSLYNYLR